MKTIQVRNHRLTLLPERAVFWPKHNLVVVADPHFGKAAAFRAHGIAIPAGTTHDNLHQLSRIIEQTRPDELIVLGDLMHAKEGKSASMLKKIDDWRKKYCQLSLVLVRGNHDKSSGEPSAEFRITKTAVTYECDGIVFTHKPERVPQKYVIAGHVHPAVQLYDRVRGKEILPCFYFGRDYAILPAFGRLTGNFMLKPGAQDKIFIIAEDEVVQIN
jgi:DNA ligase-associated metallophosphoesterase